MYEGIECMKQKCKDHLTLVQPWPRIQQQDCRMLWNKAMACGPVRHVLQVTRLWLWLKMGIVCVVGTFNMIQSAALHLSRFQSGFVWKTLEFNLNYFASRYPNWKKETKPHAQHYVDSSIARLFLWNTCILWQRCGHFVARHFVVTWNLHTPCHLQKMLAVQKQRRSLPLTKSSNPTESRGEKQTFNIIQNVRSLFTLTCPAKFSKVGLKWCI